MQPFIYKRTFSVLNWLWCNISLFFLVRLIFFPHFVSLLLVLFIVSIHVEILLQSCRYTSRIIFFLFFFASIACVSVSGGSYLCAWECNKQRNLHSHWAHMSLVQHLCVFICDYKFVCLYSCVCVYCMRVCMCVVVV